MCNQWLACHNHLAVDILSPICAVKLVLDLDAAHVLFSAPRNNLMSCLFEKCHGSLNRNLYFGVRTDDTIV
jgi:hypothetical protein